jgi:methionyl-tRNA formyltransferase
MNLKNLKRKVMQNKLSIAFFGTPELTTTILNEMVSSGYTPKLIVTMPDRKVGRKQILTAPAAKEWALANNIPVLQPEKLDHAFLAEFKNYEINTCVVFAYGKIVPQALLDMPEYGMYNVHYSLLPELRGATPVESAILLGKEKTGVTIQKMAFKLDAGAIVLQKEMKIGTDEKAIELRARLNEDAKHMVVETLKNIEAGEITTTEQDESLATHCGKISKEDGEIRLDGNVEENYRKFRAYYGWPNVYFFDKENKRVIIKEATFEDGNFIPTRVIPEGKKEVDWETVKELHI